MAVYNLWNLEIAKMEKEKIFGDIKEKFYDIDLGTESSIVVNGDSLELLNKVPDHSIALILTDPPYHSTKKRNIVGDTSFSKDSDYIEWMKKYAIEWKRVLKHNGSIFCFCWFNIVKSICTRTEFYRTDFTVLNCRDKLFL